MKYQFKTTPYKHQRKALRKLFANQYGGALLMEPRTGKTKTLIDWASALHLMGKVNKVLIVAPLSVLRVWEDEFKAHCPVDHLTILWDKEGRKDVALPLRVRRLTIVLVNYEAFGVRDPSGGRRGQHRKNQRRLRGPRGKTELKNALLKWAPDAMVLDESHKIKSPSAKRTATIRRIAWIEHRKPNADGDMRTELVPFRAIATGTAVTKQKRVYDIYSQWKFLNPDRLDEYGVSTFAEFKAEFVREKDMQGYRMWLRNKNEDELRELIHADSFAITRDECFDLPPKMPPVIVRVPLDERTKRLYDELAENMIADIETEKERARRAKREGLKAKREGRPKSEWRVKEWKITASIPLVAILRLAQLTSGVAKIEDFDTGEERLVRVSREKMRICEDLLIDEWEADQKVVVAARFRPDLAAVQAIGRKHLKTRRGTAPVWRISGGVTPAERQEGLKKFAAHDGPGLMVVQPQAASLGIDLRTASTMIWYSLTPSYVDFSQTCDRIALSDTSVTYKYLIAEGTYDEELYQILQDDGEAVRRVTRSPESLRRRK